MNKHKLLIILFSIILLVSVFSCKKKIERIEEKTRNEIEGTWKKTDVSNLSSETYEEWQINNGVFYVTIRNTSSNQKDTIYNGEYIISGDYAFDIPITKKTFTITKCSYSYYEGNWTIHKLKFDYFSIYRQKGGLEYFEFKKQ